jgi:hypothetical protein
MPAKAEAIRSQDIAQAAPDILPRLSVPIVRERPARKYAVRRKGEGKERSGTDG